MDEVKEILLCEVSNEFEATMVVNLLKEEGIPAWSDASPATPASAGSPSSRATRSSCPLRWRARRVEILSHYPHFKDLRNVHEPEL